MSIKRLRPTTKNVLLRFGLLGALAAFSGLPAKAGVLYTYTGNHFDAFSVPSTFSAADFVRIRLMYGNPLPANLALSSQGPSANADFLSLELSDGHRKLTDISPDHLVLTLATDSAGAISQWNIVHGTAGLVSFIWSHSNINDTSQWHGVFDWASASSPGTWTVQAVPEPSTALLLVGSAALSIIARRRRTRK
jgi:hypothetical protein